MPLIIIQDESVRWIFLLKHWSVSSNSSLKRAPLVLTCSNDSQQCSGRDFVTVTSIWNSVGASDYPRCDQPRNAVTDTSIINFGHCILSNRDVITRESSALTHIAMDPWELSFKSVPSWVSSSPDEAKKLPLPTSNRRIIAWMSARAVLIDELLIPFTLWF